MRLTLRTLLAYMDGILSPSDQEELAKQVGTSDNAKELIHRTGDTVRRIRLGTPPVDSPTHDANAVAEYLDNTMSPQDVMEFERRCLESDPELAEAASCHHILKMVLEQRAEVDEDLKRVVYSLPAQLAGAKDSEPVAKQPHTSGAHDPAVPDYLRASNSSFVWRVAPAAVTLLVLAGAGWLFAPGGLYDQMAAKAPAEQDGGEATPPASTPPQPNGEEETESPNPNEEAPEATSEDEGATTLPAESLSSPTGEAPPEEGSADSVDPPAEEPASAAPVTEIEPAPPVVDLAPPASASGEDSSLVVTPPDTATAPDETTTPTPDATSPAMVASADDSGQPPAEVESGEPEGASPEAGLGAEAASEPVGPVVVGLVSSSREVLLRNNEDSETWLRIPRLTDVKTGDQLLSLPYFRPVVNVQGLVFNLSGATLVEVQPSTRTPGAAKASLVYGRLIVTNAGSEEAQIEVTVGGYPGLATLNRGAVLAIEAERPFQAGLDPMVESPPLVATYYAPQGGLKWEGPEGAFEIQDQGMWGRIGRQVGLVEAYRGKVAWLDGEPITSLQSQTAAEFESNLVVDEPIWPQLEVLKDARRVENQALAAISSMHVGHYDPFIRALSDSEQRVVWVQEIEAIRATMSRSPELAEAVRDALIEFRGQRDAENLYRMLCGFSQEEIGLDRQQRQAGALRQLIDWLESDQTDYRVLANYNLEQITGRRGVFNPVGTPDSRRRRIALFRSRLEDDELVRQAR